VQLSSGSCSAASGSVKYGRVLRREYASLPEITRAVSFP
jgi:hypothetical protein